VNRSREWIDITPVGSREPVYIPGRCHHLATVPVDSVTGRIVAELCIMCDTQLPAGYSASMDPRHD